MLQRGWLWDDDKKRKSECFAERKTGRVATNVYLRKMPGKQIR